MQVLLLRTIFFIAGCPYVISHERNDSTHTKETRDGTLRSPYVSVKHPAKHQATGTPAFDIKQTLENNSKFASHLRLALDSRSKRYGYSHLVSNRTRAVRQGGTNPRKRLREHNKEELNGEMPAAMGTAGGHDNSMRGEHKRNHRRKRGTKEHHKKSFKSVKRGPKKGAVPLTPPQIYYNALASSLTLWEPMPKPLALTATDFPFDLTRYAESHTKQVDDPWDATPMTPPYAEDEESELFPNPFYPVTSETYGAYAITIVSALIFAVGVTANIAIMCVVCHNYYMRSISNALLANLAIWDFALILFCLPLVVFHELTKTWLLGQFTCKVVPYIEVIDITCKL